MTGLASGRISVIWLLTEALTVAHRLCVSMCVVQCYLCRVDICLPPLLSPLQFDTASLFIYSCGRCTFVPTCLMCARTNRSDLSFFLTLMYLQDEMKLLPLWIHHLWFYANFSFTKCLKDTGPFSSVCPYQQETMPDELDTLCACVWQVMWYCLTSDWVVQSLKVKFSSWWAWKEGGSRCCVEEKMSRRKMPWVSYNTESFLL